MTTLTSTITCPACGARSDEAMPTDACVHFYECPACHATLTPKAGDCCVFCSYGTVRCPPCSSGLDASRDASPESTDR